MPIRSPRSSRGSRPHKEKYFVAVNKNKQKRTEYHDKLFQIIINRYKFGITRYLQQKHPLLARLTTAKKTLALMLLGQLFPSDSVEGGSLWPKCMQTVSRLARH